MRYDPCMIATATATAVSVSIDLIGEACCCRGWRCLAAVLFGGNQKYCRSFLNSNLRQNVAVLENTTFVYKTLLSYRGTGVFARQVFLQFEACCTGEDCAKLDAAAESNVKLHSDRKVEANELQSG